MVIGLDRVFVHAERNDSGLLKPLTWVRVRVCVCVRMCVCVCVSVHVCCSLLHLSARLDRCNDEPLLSAAWLCVCVGACVCARKSVCG